ncbi:C2 calcium-dependent domain-containing protein 4C [Electrophorus electricus]|uniref:C2 calcium-dependent domain-containing protein 4C n=1 Tax=Electrophorus electricus TaxID=8005 RepID=UPI0015D0934D|nr:C2 calcium-dependent domain-containing protein 4C [Electrophorus electricus]
MWILRKVRESAESLPEDISRLISKNSEEISAKTNLLHKLHSNVLTPEKIPDFFLPPRLSRRSLVAAEGIIPKCISQKETICGQDSLSKLKMTTVLMTDENKGTVVTLRGKKNPVPFSLKCFEPGLFESPNTRRKESLFHSTFTRYELERMVTTATPKLPSIARLKLGSIESDTLSSADSSPHCSPPPSWPIRSKRENTNSLSLLASKRSLSKGVPLQSKNPSNMVWSTVTKMEKRGITGTNCHASVVCQATPSTLVPPFQFPLDMLHCQECLHREHMLLLPRRGCIRISASRSNHTGDPATICIRVISVEGLREAGDLRPLHCSLTLSLAPGKLQRQHSATIRNCRNPVFNEDFFFTEPEAKEGRLRELALRVKVLDKPSGFGRAIVLGITVKPVSQLLPL